MNKTTMGVALLSPFALVLSLVVAIPLLLGADEDCAPSGATGPTSQAISVMTWNLCASSCGNWDQRISPAVAEVARQQPDILAVQEGGWSTSKRTLTSKGFASIGYTNATTRAPHIGRYVFYNPAKFALLKSGSFSLGGHYGMAWAVLKTKADGIEFGVVDTHLTFPTTAAGDTERRTELRTGMTRARRLIGGVPTIWPGDYNSNKSRRTDSPAQVMAAAGMDDSVAIAANKRGDTINSAKGRSATASVKTDGNQVDHIYVSRGITVSAWQQITHTKAGHYVPPFVTDHNPLIATVGLPGAKTAPPTTKQPVADVGTWNREQVKSASKVAAAGKAMKISERGQAIAIMTAMTESHLQAQVGAKGSGRLGLFQQDSSWGTPVARTNPTASARLFYEAMVRVDGWADLEPTIAAHRVQRNADPNAYNKYWDDAVQVLASLTGTNLNTQQTAVAPDCSTDIVDAAWASGADCDFGNLTTPVTCQQALANAARISRQSPCHNQVRGGTWRRECLEFVARAYGYRYAGTATAKGLYRILNARGLVHTDHTPPAGALVFFDSSDPAGHVALYAGDGKAFSNDYIRTGCIDLTPVSRLASGGRYLGWAPPVFPNGGPL
jgi:hypothetical protein